MLKVYVYPDSCGCLRLYTILIAYLIYDIMCLVWELEFELSLAWTYLDGDA